MSYTELSKRLMKVLDERRRISTNKLGMLPLKGHEEEHECLSKKAEKIRKEMRRARYGTIE